MKNSTARTLTTLVLAAVAIFATASGIDARAASIERLQSGAGICAAPGVYAIGRDAIGREAIGIDGRAITSNINKEDIDGAITNISNIDDIAIAGRIGLIRGTSGIDRIARAGITSIGADAGVIGVDI